MTRDEIILGNLNVANSIAAKYAAQSPWNRDDIMSAAYYGLVRAADIENPSPGYIAERIEGEVRHSLRKNQTISRPDRSFLADYLTHEGNMEERASAMGLTAESVFGRLNVMAHTVPLNMGENIPSRPESQLNEILEVCLTYLNPRIHHIFILRYRDQFSQLEIGKMTGYSQSQISVLLRRAIDALRLKKDELADILF